MTGVYTLPLVEDALCYIMYGLDDWGNWAVRLVRQSRQ